MKAALSTQARHRQVVGLARGALAGEKERSLRDVVNTEHYHVPMANPFTQAVRASASSDLLFISGITARDRDGVIQAEADLEAQTDWILSRIGCILEASGATYDNVIKITVFVVEGNDMDSIRHVKSRYFRDPQPASTTVYVSRLFDPRQLVEIEAIASIQSDGRVGKTVKAQP